MYYKVTVKTTIQDAMTGKEKKASFNHIVNAESVKEASAKTIDYWEGSPYEHNISNVSEMKIESVIE